MDLQEYQLLEVFKKRKTDMMTVNGTLKDRNQYTFKDKLISTCEF